MLELIRLVLSAIGENEWGLQKCYEMQPEHLRFGIKSKIQTFSNANLFNL